MAVLALLTVLADTSVPGWLVVVVLVLAGLALVVWLIRTLR
jgi:hypothetical protein